MSKTSKPAKPVDDLTALAEKVGVYTDGRKKSEEALAKLIQARQDEILTGAIELCARVTSLMQSVPGKAACHVVTREIMDRAVRKADELEAKVGEAK